MIDSPTRVESRGAPAGGAVERSGGGFRPARMLLPLAGAVVAALVAVSLLVGFRLASQMNDLRGENAAATAHLAAADSRLLDSLLQLRVLSYWLAYPASEALLLDPPGGTGDSQGVLLIAEEGRSAILMVVNMEELPVPSDYQVWLTAGGQRVRAGRLRVDSTGWGVATLYPSESLLAFDGVEVTAENEGGAGSASGVRVLEGRIVSPKAPP